MNLERESRHSDYGEDAGGYSVLRFNGEWIGRVDKREAADALIAYVKSLLDELARLQWQPITSETIFDKSLDYLLARPLRSSTIIKGSEFQRPTASKHLRSTGWTHFRPINPPKETA